MPSKTCSPSHHAIIADDGMPVTCAYCGTTQIVYVFEPDPAGVCCDCWLRLHSLGERVEDRRFEGAGRKNSQSISPVSP
jgi:hypothetical protein